MLYRHNSVTILCLKAMLPTVREIVRYHMSYNGNIQKHPNKRALSSKPAGILCDISTLAPRILSHIFNHSIFIAIQ